MNRHSVHTKYYKEKEECCELNVCVPSNSYRAEALFPNVMIFKEGSLGKGPGVLDEVMSGWKAMMGSVP